MDSRSFRASRASVVVFSIAVFFFLTDGIKEATASVVDREGPFLKVALFIVDNSDLAIVIIEAYELKA